MPLRGRVSGPVAQRTQPVVRMNPEICAAMAAGASSKQDPVGGYGRAAVARLTRGDRACVTASRQIRRARPAFFHQIDARH